MAERNYEARAKISLGILNKNGEGEREAERRREIGVIIVVYFTGVKGYCRAGAVALIKGRTEGKH